MIPSGIDDDNDDYHSETPGEDNDDGEDTEEREMQDERKKHNEQEQTDDKQEPMEVTTIKVFCENFYFLTNITYNVFHTDRTIFPIPISALFPTTLLPANALVSLAWLVLCV